MDPLATGQQIATSPIAAQVWIVLVAACGAVIWLIRTMREDSEGLRQELREQSNKREQLMDRLTEVVKSNTAAITHNTEVLDKAKYQLQRSQESLDKFSS